MSRLCPGLPDFAALSRNPARLYKWRCGTSINSVYYRISVRISRCLVGVAVHDRPKVGVVDQKWAWSVNFRARFARVNTIFYFVPVSLINLATMLRRVLEHPEHPPWIRHCGQCMFTSLQAGFWDRLCWKLLKAKVEVLSRMLQRYADIISEKRLKMMELHSSSEQVRTIANSTTVQHLAAHYTLDQHLQGLSSAVEEADPVSLENFLPTDRCRPTDHRRWYEYMERVNEPADYTCDTHLEAILATFIIFGIPRVQTSRRLCVLSAYS